MKRTLRMSARTKKGYFAAVGKHLFALGLVLWLIYFFRSPGLIKSWSYSSRPLGTNDSVELGKLLVYENLVPEKVVSGTVGNLSATPVEGVKVQVVWYNSRGKQVLSKELLLKEIPAEGECEFVIKFPKVKGLDNYQVSLK